MTEKTKVSKEVKRKTKIKLKNEKEKNVMITKDTNFIELLEKKPEAFNLLFQAGLHCLGCSMSAYETIEQGCLAHGMSQKDIANLIKQLNN